MDAIRVVNWDTFQHYRKRHPPWIKVYRRVLDDMDYLELDDMAARLLFELWLLASEGDGIVEMRRLVRYKHCASKALAKPLQTLTTAGFIEDASKVLARCKQDAILRREEKRREERVSPTEKQPLPKGIKDELRDILN